MESRPALLARLTRALASTEPRSPLSLRLCLAFSEITASQGGAITMGFAPPERVTLSATNEWAERLEDLQDFLREGPSLDAFRTGVAVGGLTQPEQVERWPLLCETLGSEGELFALHAYPMRPTSIVLGVLTVYQSHARGIPISADEAQFLADAIGVAILGELDAEADFASEGSYGDQPWGDRDRVAAATGMVVAQLRVPPVDALAVLRAHAFAHDTTLLDVSRRVVARELDFRPAPAGDA